MWIALVYGEYSRTGRSSTFGSDGDLPGLCSSGHDGRDLSIGVHGKAGGSDAVKFHGARLRETDSGDDYGRPNFPGGWREAFYLGKNFEDGIAGQSGRPSCNGDRSGKSTGGNRHRDVGSALQHGVRCSHSVKLDDGGTAEALPEDVD